MKRMTIVAAGLALLVLGAGAAAAQPSPPADVQQPESPADGSTVEEPAAENASDENMSTSADEVAAPGNGSAAEGDVDRDAERAGPPVDMPSQVPDHVSEIHALIGQFIEGDLDGSLGDEIRGVLGGQERGAQLDGDRSDAGQASTGQSNAGQTNASQANQGQTGAEQPPGKSN